MSIASDAAKAWIRRLLADEYGQVPISASEMKQNGGCFKKASVRSVQKDMIDGGLKVFEEYYFTEIANWRFDYAVPHLFCASCERTFHWSPPRTILSLMDAIELDGSTFVQNTGHTSGVGLRNWREKNNAAMTLGWRVFHYAPEEVIKSGRKTMNDEPILLRLPWLH